MYYHSPLSSQIIEPRTKLKYFFPPVNPDSLTFHPSFLPSSFPCHQNMSSKQACEMSKPTILLVGGAWHTANYLSPLVATLEAAGYPTTALGLPSVGPERCDLNFDRDVTPDPLHGHPAGLRGGQARRRSLPLIWRDHRHRSSSRLPLRQCAKGNRRSSRIGVHCDHVARGGPQFRMACGVCWRPCVGGS